MQIASNSVLTVDAGRTCPSRPQPDPQWLTAITFIAQMALQKQQGQDGRLEVGGFRSTPVRVAALTVSVVQAIKLVGQGTSTIKAFELAISRMVSVAATEMYAILDDATMSAVKNGSLAAVPWTNGQTVAFRTPQSRLGAVSAVYWGVAPAFMALLLLAGWMRWSTHSSPSEFDPLHPVSMAAAGWAESNRSLVLILTHSLLQTQLDRDPTRDHRRRQRFREGAGRSDEAPSLPLRRGRFRSPGPHDSRLVSGSPSLARQHVRPRRSRQVHAATGRACSIPRGPLQREESVLERGALNQDTGDAVSTWRYLSVRPLQLMLRSV